MTQKQQLLHRRHLQADARGRQELPRREKMQQTRILQGGHLNSPVKRVSNIRSSPRILRPLRILHSVVEETIQPHNPGLNLQLLRQRIRPRWTGSRPGQTLRVTRIRLLVLNMLVNMCRMLLQSREDVSSRVPAPAASAPPLGLRLESLCKPSRPKQLVDPLPLPETLPRLLGLLQGVFSRPLVHLVSPGDARTSRLWSAPFRRIWAATPPQPIPQLPLQLDSAFSLMKKDSASMGIEPLPHW